MKKLTAAAILAMVVLTGCSGSVDDSGHDNGFLKVQLVHLPDGTTVDCVTRTKAGIDCDWDRRS